MHQDFDEGEGHGSRTEKGKGACGSTRSSKQPLSSRRLGFHQRCGLPARPKGPCRVVTRSTRLPRDAPGASTAGHSPWRGTERQIKGKLRRGWKHRAIKGAGGPLGAGWPSKARKLPSQQQCGQHGEGMCFTAKMCFASQ